MPLGVHKVALFGVAGVSTGSAVLLETAVASDDASIEFTLPTAYKQVKFGFYNISTATAPSVDFQFQVNASGQSGFNETMTTTFFRTYHEEVSTNPLLGYTAGKDQAQGTSYQTLFYEVDDESDGSAVGEMILYNPASTTYVKHFTAVTQGMQPVNTSKNDRCAGYINTTTNLSEISFKMSSGNIDDGTIKMWGIK